MGLEALELLEGREMWVAVIKCHNIANGNLIAIEMIEERAAIGIRGKWPAN